MSDTLINFYNGKEIKTYKLHLIPKKNLKFTTLFNDFCIMDYNGDESDKNVYTDCVDVKISGSSLSYEYELWRESRDEDGFGMWFTETNLIFGNQLLCGVAYIDEAPSKEMMREFFSNQPDTSLATINSFFKHNNIYKPSDKKYKYIVSDIAEIGDLVYLTDDKKTVGFGVVESIDKLAINSEANKAGVYGIKYHRAELMTGSDVRAKYKLLVQSFNQSERVNTASELIKSEVLCSKHLSSFLIQSNVLSKESAQVKIENNIYLVSNILEETKSNILDYITFLNDLYKNRQDVVDALVTISELSYYEEIKINSLISFCNTLAKVAEDVYSHKLPGVNYISLPRLTFLFNLDIVVNKESTETTDNLKEDLKLTREVAGDCIGELEHDLKILLDGVSALYREMNDVHESHNPHEFSFRCRLGGQDADDFTTMLDKYETLKEKHKR